MGSLRSENEVRSTPKLALSKLPSKQREPKIMSTPPFNRLVSIPFEWEEAPGKPRAEFITAGATTTTSPPSQNKATAARCLDLPPRLLNNAKVTNAPSSKVNNAKVTNAASPTTVLDGPYISPLSQTSSFSLPKGSLRSLEEELLRGEMYWKRESKESQKPKLASWRWGSFKEMSRMAGDSDGFSSCISVASRNRHRSAAKVSRIKSKSSFLRFSQTSSNLLTGVYGSFKQMVPWRRRQE